MATIRRYGPYLAGALVILIGVVWFIVGLVGAVTRADDGVAIRIVAPAARSIRLEGGKTYTVFFEHRSIVDGQVYHSRPQIPLRMKVTESATGGLINLQPPRVTTTYAMGARQGFSLAEFQVDRAGLYTVDVSSQGEEPFVVVVGDSFVTGKIGAIFGVMFRLFGGLLAGGLIIVITLLRRRRSERSPSPPPVPYAPYQPPPS